MQYFLCQNCQPSEVFLSFPLLVNRLSATTTTPCEVLPKRLERVLHVWYVTWRHRVQVSDPLSARVRTWKVALRGKRSCDEVPSSSRGRVPEAVYMPTTKIGPSGYGTWSQRDFTPTAAIVRPRCLSHPTPALCNLSVPIGLQGQPRGG